MHFSEDHRLDTINSPREMGYPGTIRRDMCHVCVFLVSVVTDPVLSQIQRYDNFISVRREMCHVWVFLVGVVTDPAL